MFALSHFITASVKQQLMTDIFNILFALGILYNFTHNFVTLSSNVNQSRLNKTLSVLTFGPLCMPR